MKAGEFVLRLVAVVTLWGMDFSVHARSLSDQVMFLFGERGITLTNQATPGAAGGPTVPPVPHTAHFTSDSLATLGLLVQQLAPNAADFPAISTVPGLTFRYNPEIQAFERSTTNLGPVYVERPLTLGRGKLDLGLSYLYIDFEELDGDNLDGLAFRGLAHNDCCPVRPGVGDPAFEGDTADLIFDEFDLRSHVVSLSATYGITDRWDVNLFLPIIHTTLDIRARGILNNESGTGTHFFDGRVTEQVRSVDDGKTGVGDLLLRTKYHLFNYNSFNLSSGLTLRVPTGDEDDFQGIGDVTLLPFFSLAQEYGPFDLHLSAGVEINTDDLDRSRARYAGGVTYQVVDSLALLVDVIGSSNVTTEQISVTVPSFINAPGTGALQVGLEPRPSRDLRTDIVDLAVGFKATFAKSLVGFAHVFVPLNDDGLRADMIPAAGLEMSF